MLVVGMFALNATRKILAQATVEAPTATASKQVLTLDEANTVAAKGALNFYSLSTKPDSSAFCRCRFCANATQESSRV
ncbi:hypothetical protein FMN63_29090 [Stappia sp. BW2]|uniref:hypothetical protein n=1 Tax=Stappia sp. BW2 TaxID=2592622 RepID=UPI0011DE61F0|nr:hypothetical protein [Stappia sp. BW2]TYC63112.1 hypothetical protein FMN63_29090 [Stappia sp. BW2]